MSQWRGFLKKSKLDDAPQDLQEAVDVISAFLLPVANCVKMGQDSPGQWVAPGPWKKA
jgi:hypothetical protein